MWLIVISTAVLLQVNGFLIEKGDGIVQFKKTFTGYTLHMNEDNHESDVTRGLLKISGSEEHQPEIKKDPGFKYHFESIGPGYWQLFAKSSFDYETQLRFYVFDVYFNDEFQTITLLINNIDDEQPSISCPDHMEIWGENIYNVTNKVTCNVSDPDGFLSRMSFKFKNPESPLQLALPDGIPDVVHKSPVYLNTKTIIRGPTTLMEYLEAKDSAGHHTSPNADVMLVVHIISFPRFKPDGSIKKIYT